MFEYLKEAPMTDTVLLSAGRYNARECVELAQQHGLGIEIMMFAFPDVLDGNWLRTLGEYKQMIADVPGPITMHGPFMDLVSGSPDNRINELCFDRYSHAIRIAGGLEAKQVIFHANYIGLLHNQFYRDGWHNRNIDFWTPLAEYAEQFGVMIAIENMWEYDPTIIGDLIKDINHPHLKACLDVGHAHLFTDKSFAFDEWLSVMAPHLIEIHMNNNNGVLDEHHGFDWEKGVLDYHELIPKLRELPNKPVMVLEMDRVSDMEASLHYFQLAEPAEQESIG